MANEQLDGPVSLDIRPAKKPRACLHCHVRKVRCNAWEVGIPCTRCKRRDQAGTCVLVDASHRRIPSSAKYKKQRQFQVNPATQTSHVGTSLPGFESLQATSARQDHHHHHLADSGPPFPAGTIISPSRPDQDLQNSGQGLPLMDFPLEGERVSDMGEGGDPPVGEDDVHLHICQEMSRGSVTAMSPSPQAQKLDRREVIEFHEGINSMTILGEVLGHQRPNRLVRVVLADDPKLTSHHRFPGLDDADMAYIAAKGALDFPSPHICDELLKIYFSTIFPYAPILDRVKFMHDYRANRHSPFLMQSILANAVPHAPKELLQEAGYKDRITAQQSLFSKARLLYDIGCEKSQLCLLQGSVMLSSLSFSYAMDKDYRHWLTNAGRIATLMGLHRNYVSETLGLRTKRLFRRIWWVLYNRDTLLTISGIDNLRRFNDRFCDTAPLTEADWEEDGEIPEEFRDILPPVPSLQKVFMVELSKLSIISGQFLRDFKAPGVIPTTEDIDHMSDKISAWRKQLPAEMQLGTLQEWSSENIWILVLLAMGYRLEAVFCRASKEVYKALEDSRAVQRTSQRQESAMFELSTIIQRASMHEVLHLCPLSFMTCASTILAMRIENALDPNLSARKQLASKTQIFAELEYLRESCEYWSSLIWTLRMFEAVISRTRLGLTADSPEELRESDVETPVRNTAEDGRGFTVDAATRHREAMSGNTFTVSTTADLSMSMSDDVFGILPVTDNYDWLQSLLGSEGQEPATDFLNEFL